MQRFFIKLNIYSIFGKAGIACWKTSLWTIDEGKTCAGRKNNSSGRQTGPAKARHNRSQFFFNRSYRRRRLRIRSCLLNGMVAEIGFDEMVYLFGSAMRYLKKPVVKLGFSFKLFRAFRSKFGIACQTCDFPFM